MNHKKKRVFEKITAGVFILLLCVLLCGCDDRTAVFLEETPEEEAVETIVEVTVPPEKIYVDVCGAVNQPGVYSLEPGSRVFQAVEAAGGCSSEAAGEYINQAELLDDGQQIYVPSRQEVEEQKVSGGNSVMPQGGLPGQELSETNGKVNLNTADEAELTSLTGIGATRAQAIILYRQENGPFSSIEEIMNVQGIKEATFEKIKDDIAVG